VGIRDFLRGLAGRGDDDAQAESVADEAPFGDAPSSGQVAMGEEVVLEAASPTRPVGAVFEDDGTTAYFYALDFRDPDRIQVATHIYDVPSAAEGRLQHVEIRWSSDGSKVGLFINGEPAAAFDFERTVAYSRSPFGLSGRWTSGGWPAEIAEVIS
jgi:hypothetical protein